MTLIPKKKVPAFWNCLANIIYFSFLTILFCVFSTAFMIGSINPTIIIPDILTLGLCGPLLACLMLPILFHKTVVCSIIIDDKAELLTIHYKSSLSLFAKSYAKVIPYSELEYCCEQMPCWVIILNYVLFFIPMFRITLFSKSQFTFVFRQSCGWTRDQYSEIISALRTIKEPRVPEDLLF